MVDAMQTYLRKMPLSHLSQYQICAQIFITGPQTYDETLSREDKIFLRSLVDAKTLSLFIHGAYVDFPWNDSAVALYNIKKELAISSDLMAHGVIVHLGKNTMHSLESVLHQLDDDAILWLEIPATKSSPDTFDQAKNLSKLYRHIKKMNLRLQVGLCIDTAHLHSAGVNLSSSKDAARWFNELHSVWHFPIMIHLNDSKTELGKGKDMHEKLCCGKIWSEYHPANGDKPFAQSGLSYILSMCSEKKYPIIMERHSKDIDDDIAILSSIV